MNKLKQMICLEGIHFTLHLISAKVIIFNMNKRVDPCDDFYEFACGGYVEKTKIPSDKFQTNLYGILRDDLALQLCEILEKDIQPNELKTFKLVKTLYKSCMNESMYFNTNH